MQQTFSMVPAAKPITRARPFHAMHLRESNTLVRTYNTNGRKFRTIYQTDRVINDINALPLGQGQNLLLPASLRVVYTIIRSTKLFCDVNFFL